MPWACPQGHQVRPKEGKKVESEGARASRSGVGEAWPDGVSGTF